jgi:hypothetical protein
MRTLRQGSSTSRSSSLLTVGSNQNAAWRSISRTRLRRASGIARKPGTVQNPGNLTIDRGREGEHIDFLGTQQRAFRNAVRLEHRTYEG